MSEVTTKRWPGWFAPAQLPFVVDELADADRAALPAASTLDVAMELPDAFWIYPADQPRAWLSCAEFDALPTGLHRRLVSAQRDEHEVWLHGPDGRFAPWWPGLFGGPRADRRVHPHLPLTVETAIDAAAGASTAGSTVNGWFERQLRELTEAFRRTGCRCSLRCATAHHAQVETWG